MIQAISTGSAATVTNPTQGTRANPAVLQAQLQKFEKKLTECVNCESAKTPEGKKNIEEISRNMDNVKSRLTHLTQNQLAQNSASQQSIAPISQAYGVSQGQYINTFA